jgi:PAS domain S-box-containing protein
MPANPPPHLIPIKAGAPSLFSRLLSFLTPGGRDAARLANVEARVAGIVESAMDAIVSIDEAQRIVLFNSAAEKVFGRSREAVIGQPLDVLIPERYRAAHGQHIERFGSTGTTSRDMGAQTVLYGLRASGEEFPIEASISQHREGGRKIFTVILRDVTERVRADEMLARSEARLRGILDSAMDAIITVDESQHVVLFNAAAEQVFGVSRAEAVGAPLARFIPDRFRGGHDEHVRRFGATGTSSRRMGAARIVAGLRSNGEEFPIDASISQTSEGGRRFYTVILRDVTERVRAEEALRESREEIRDLARAASTVREQEKSRIARELHDELGQALTALKFDVGWLRERVGGASDELGTKLAAMHAVIDGTVAATRRISADLRPLMLDDLGLGAAAEWLVQNFTARTRIQCSLAIEGDVELPDPYATAVFRVLQESLTNVSRHAQATQVDVVIERVDGEVRLNVRDNGRGFDQADARKPNSFGLLGLRERATLLGGDVRIDSAPGRGTAVDMRLPLTPTEASA